MIPNINLIVIFLYKSMWNFICLIKKIDFNFIKIILKTVILFNAVIEKLNFQQPSIFVDP